MVSVAPASAKDWFVDNVSGSDANDGTRVTHPFKTIKKALTWHVILSVFDVLFLAGTSSSGR